MEVEDFLSQLEKLIEEGKDEEAEKLVKEFAKGKEDEVAGLLLEVMTELIETYKDEQALHYLKIIKSIVKTSETKRKILINCAHTYFEIGVYFSNLSEKKDRESNLRKSIDAFKKASQVYREGGFSYLNAVAKGNLAVAYTQIAQMRNTEEFLSLAIITFKDILKTLTKKAFPFDYAKIQHNLGGTYRELADVRDKEKNLYLAIGALKKALKFRKAETFPFDYAMTQNNLGFAYITLSEIRDKEKNLKIAIKAYKNALIICTEDVSSVGYAMIQNNLGLAFANLAEIRDEEENLSLAIKAYENSLKIYTKANFPYDYARMQNNLGNIYIELARVKGEEKNLIYAINACNEALSFFTKETFPKDFATSQNNIGIAYVLLSQIRDKENNINVAIKAFKNSLEIRREENLPLDYAMTQNNLALAYKALAELKDKEKNINLAIGAFKNAIRTDPFWIGPSVNLSQLLFAIRNYNEAKDIFNKASEIYSILGLESKSKEMKAFALWMVAFLSYDSEILENAIERYKEVASIFDKIENHELADYIRIFLQFISLDEKFRNIIHLKSIAEMKRKSTELIENTEILKIPSNMPESRIFIAKVACFKILDEILESCDNIIIGQKLDLSHIRKQIDYPRKIFDEIGFANEKENLDVYERIVTIVENAGLGWEKQFISNVQNLEIYDGYSSKKSQIEYLEKLIREEGEKIRKHTDTRLSITEQNLISEMRSLFSQLQSSTNQIIAQIKTQNESLLSVLEKLGNSQIETLKMLSYEEIENEINDIKGEEEKEKKRSFFEKAKTWLSIFGDISSIVGGLIVICNFISTGQFDAGTALSIQMIQNNLDKIKLS